MTRNCMLNASEYNTTPSSKKKEQRPCLFISSDSVAADIEKIGEEGVQHIVNAAGCVCANHHADLVEMSYTTFMLYNGAMQDKIGAVYNALLHIENAR